MEHSLDESLSKWPIFSLLEESFLRSLKLVLVFGSSGNEAVVVTHDDQAYALGANAHGCLGLGDTKGSFHPRRVKELCNQGALEVVRMQKIRKMMCSILWFLEEPKVV